MLYFVSSQSQIFTVSSYEHVINIVTSLDPKIP